MRNLKLFLIGFFGCALIATCGDIGASDKLVPKDPNLIQKKLDNGFEYYLYPKNDGGYKNRIALRFLVNSGPIFEDEKTFGYNHLIGQIAVKNSDYFFPDSNTSKLPFGSVNLSPPYDQHSVYDFGPQWSGYSIDDKNASLNKIDRHLNKFRQLAAYMDLTRTVGNDKTQLFKHEAQSLINRIVKKEEILGLNKDFKFSPLQYHLLPAQPKNEQIIKALKNISYERFELFYRNFYQPDRMKLIIVGDFDHEQIENIIKAKFNSITRNNTSFSPKKRDRFSHPPQFKKVEKDDLISQFVYLYELKDDFAKAPTPENFEFRLKNTVVAGAIARHMQERLLDIKRANLNIYAHFSKMNGKSYFTLNLPVFNYAVLLRKKSLNSLKEEILKNGFNPNFLKDAIKNDYYIAAHDGSRNPKKYGIIGLRTNQIVKIIIQNEKYVDLAYELKIRKKWFESLDQEMFVQHFKDHFKKPSLKHVEYP